MSAEPEGRPDNGDADPRDKRDDSRERGAGKGRSRSRSRSRGAEKERSRSRSAPKGGGGKGRSRSRSRSRGGAKGRSRSRSRGRGGGGDKKRRLKGEACRWNTRGFGFIKPEEGGGEDLFCHVSSIKDGNMLRDGDIVEYEESWDERKNKYMADNVTGGVREEDYGRGGRGGGGGRDRSRDRYDDRRDDRRGGGRDDRYDDRRGGGGRDRYDDRDRRDRY